MSSAKQKSSAKQEEGIFPISVTQDVVSYLSKGLYRNIARAVKELISNAYDANATEVKIGLDLENRRIIVRDNGHGMNKEEVRKKFLRIGRPTVIDSKTDELNRRRIGTFGIGFLSTFPYCENFKLITKKKDSDVFIEVNIETSHFFKDEVIPIEKIKVPYKIFESDLPFEQGETLIILEGIETQLIEELNKESIGSASLDKLGGYEKFKWSIAQYAPIQFPPDRRDLRNYFNVFDSVPLRLWLDGEELFRNVPDEAIILEKDEFRYGEIVLKYVIMTTMNPISPEEARGFQIRLRDVAIGFPKDFKVIQQTSRVLGKLNYLCGEIHIIEGLDSSIMIDRDEFSFTTDTAEMEDFFRNKLKYWNLKLENWAKEDKAVYEVLSVVDPSHEIAAELQEANILRFSKERLRIPKVSSVTSSKTIPVTSTIKKLVIALSNREGLEVKQDNAEVSEKLKPVEISRNKKIITVYTKHAIFSEKLVFRDKEYSVFYDSWDYTEFPFSICKLTSRNKLTFNKSHPLFSTKLNERIIKEFSLGILLFSKNRPDENDLISELNHLIMEIFVGE